MTRHNKTNLLIASALEILTAYHPMTVRQVYYQLVSSQVIENNRGEYQAVSNAIVQGRREGLIPWEWVDDRLRRPRSVTMWDDLPDFADTAVASYRRCVWASQPTYLEAWLEKDALSGLFEEVLEPYGVTLNVGRGYDGWDSIHNAAQRFGSGKGKTILYYGDLDPSGEDMVRSLRERLASLGSSPEIIKCAINPEDVKNFNLPPAFAKQTDTRRAGYVTIFGDMCVELDALPATVLQDRLRTEIEKRMDLDALAESKRLEKADKETLRERLSV
jgi:hypothetical protein